MDIAQLDLAYDRLVAAAKRITPSAVITTEQREVDWTLSHVALSDRILAEVARQVKAGVKARIDNSEAMDEQAIKALVEATSHEQRTDLVARCARDLIAVLADTPAERASATVPTRLVDRSGAVVFDAELVWGEVVSTRATVQIPGHAARLEKM